MGTLYYSHNVIRMIKCELRWEGNVTIMGEDWNAFTILTCKPLGEGPLD